MRRPELIFLHSASADGCNAWHVLDEIPEQRGANAQRRIEANNSAPRRRKKTSPKRSSTLRTGFLRYAANPARASSRNRRRPSAKPPRLFTEEYEVITKGQRSPKWVGGHWRLHLLPFFGDMGVSEVNEDAAQAYRVYRLTGKEPGEADAAFARSSKPKVSPILPID
jgi:hypothetical protein